MADKKLHCGCLSTRKTTLVVGIIQLVAIIVVMIWLNAVYIPSIKAITPIETLQPVRTFFIVINCLSLVPMGITILLIIGALKRDRCLLLPWVIMAWIEVPLGVISFIGSLPSKTALGTILLMVNCLFTCYCLLVVTEYKSILKEARDINAPSGEPLGAPLTGNLENQNQPKTSNAIV